jgi:hypothetical protein
MVRFQVLTAAIMKIRIFLDIRQYSLGADRRFRGAYYLHHQSRHPEDEQSMYH